MKGDTPKQGFMSPLGSENYTKSKPDITKSKWKILFEKHEEYDFD